MIGSSVPAEPRNEREATTMSEPCQQILRDLEAYLDGELEVSLEQVVATHLSDCPPCMHRADFERRLRQLVARACTARAPEVTLARVRQRLAEAT